MNLQYMKLQILAIGLIVLAGYLGGVLAKKLKIGEVIGQMLGGVLVGPHLLKAVLACFGQEQELPAMLDGLYHFIHTDGFHSYEAIIESFHFFVFMFLGLIAFSLGEELHLDRLKEVGFSAVTICLVQGVITFVVLSVPFYYLFDFSLINSLIIGSIGIATAPALTFILMRKLRVEGKLKNLLANVVVLDDLMEVIFFSIFLGIAVYLQMGKEVSFLALGQHLLIEIFLALLLGLIIFVLIFIFLRGRSSSDESKTAKDDRFLSTFLSDHPTPSVEVLLFIIGVVSVGIAVSIHLDLPFLITAIFAGFLVANLHYHAIFDSLKIDNVMPIFNLLFFAIIGASIQLETFSWATIGLSLSYVVLRSAGKLVGNHLGTKYTGQDPMIVAFFPKLMLPQAGMAAVETILVATVLAGSGGETIFNIIIPALVIFEVGGALLSERTLIKWKNWTIGEKEVCCQTTAKSFSELEELLQKREIFLQTNSRQEVLASGLDCLRSERVVRDDNYQEILASLLAREKLSSTYMDKGVAVPHCRLEELDQPYLVKINLAEATIWDKQQNKVKQVFLILTGAKDPKQHLRAIRAVAHSLQNKE